MSLTFQDISEFVFLQLESDAPKQPTPVQLRLLANLALDKITIRESSWTNGGILDGTTGAFTLPTDCRNITSVVFNGVSLTRLSVGDMNINFPDWRTDTGTPECYMLDGTDVVLNCLASGAIGVLQIFGSATIGHFSDVVGAINPLDYIALEHQIEIAYFILSKLPFHPSNPAGLARIQMYSSAWETALQSIQYGASGKRSQPFGEADGLE